MTLRALSRRLARDRRGATALEYALIAALVVIAMIVGLAMLARSTNAMLTNVGNAVSRSSPD